MKPTSLFCVFLSVLCSPFLETLIYSANSPSEPAATAAPYRDATPYYHPTTADWSNLSVDSWSGINRSNDLIPSQPFNNPTFYKRILFPTVPPVLGDPLPTQRIGSIRHNDIEAQLSPYVNELFYAPLSGLFTEEDLSRRRRHKLEAFRILQAELIAELRSHMEAVRDAPNELRRQDFARLAAEQAPRLDDLEARAEALRADFVHGGFLSTSVNWDDTRDWRLGDDLTFESRQDEAQVVRAAAYFQEGLSYGQRQLLRELAIELSETIGQPTAGLELDQPKPFIFFSPSTARVRLPYNLPPDFAEKVAAYTAEKAALKGELREVIYAKDSAWLNLFRSRALRDLAQKQASRIAALDMMAEEIRDRLALLPETTQRHDEELPAKLNRRIQQYLARKQSVENIYLAKLGAVRTLSTRDRLEFGRNAGLAAIWYTPSRSHAKKTSAAIASAQEDLATFNLQRSETLRQLEKEKEDIQNEVAAVLRQKYSLLVHLPADVVVREYGKIFEWQVTWQRYGDYQTAVLEPGLSPAQRRLLFGAALEKLRLPPTR